MQQNFYNLENYRIGSSWIRFLLSKFNVYEPIFFLADAYSWVSVFVIPVNSAFNPLLYTLTTPKYREIIKYSLAKRMQPFSLTRHQISTAGKYLYFLFFFFFPLIFSNLGEIRICISGVTAKEKEKNKTKRAKKCKVITHFSFASLNSIIH